MKHLTICIILFFLTSCGIGFIPVLSSGGKQTYKYRCHKVGDCCEVGKNCEEDLAKEAAKKAKESKEKK